MVFKLAGAGLASTSEDRKGCNAASDRNVSVIKLGEANLLHDPTCPEAQS